MCLFSRLHGVERCRFQLGPWWGRGRSFPRLNQGKLPRRRATTRDVRIEFGGTRRGSGSACCWRQNGTARGQPAHEVLTQFGSALSIKTRRVIQHAPLLIIAPPRSLVRFGMDGKAVAVSTTSFILGNTHPSDWPQATPPRTAFVPAILPTALFVAATPPNAWLSQEAYDAQG
jgi:hypothetical protein